MKSGVPGPQRKLEAGVARNEAKPLVKAMGIEPRFIARELDHHASSRSTLFYGPFDECMANAMTTRDLGDSHRFDLASPRTAMAQAGEVADLECSDQLAVVFGDRQQLVRILIDGFKGRKIGRIERLAHVFSRLPERVVGEHGYDRLDIFLLRGPKVRHDAVASMNNRRGQVTHYSL